MLDFQNKQIHTEEDWAKIYMGIFSKKNQKQKTWIRKDNFYQTKI